jgi:biopolymer transport protein ExbD
MKFHREPTEDLELNLTPLIDVVFLLLIFFMVSTTFQKESEISLQLPTATQKPVDASDDRIEVVINAAGHFYVNDQELVQSDFPSLQTALRKISNGNHDIPLTIRADAQTPHQAVVIAMDAAAQLGMLRMSIATSHRQE